MRWCGCVIVVERSIGAIHANYNVECIDEQHPACSTCVCKQGRCTLITESSLVCWGIGLFFVLFEWFVVFEAFVQGEVPTLHKMIVGIDARCKARDVDNDGCWLAESTI
jgi:hypothetical protein